MPTTPAPAGDRSITRCPGTIPMPLPSPTDARIADAIKRIREAIRREKDRFDMGGAMVFTAALIPVAREEAGYAADDAGKPT